MTRLFFALLTLFFLSGPAMGKYSDFGLLSNAANGGPTLRSYAWGADLSGGDDAGGIGGLAFIRFHLENKTLAVAADGQGNTSTLYDMEDASLKATYEYGPFGELLRASGSFAAVNPFRFSTKYETPETGWLAYTFRDYIPALGRWASRDPIGEAGGLHLSAFVGNDPVNLIDPFGLDSFEFIYNGMRYRAYRYTGEMSSLAGKTFGEGRFRGECAAGAQELSGAPDTRTWLPNTPTLAELLAAGIEIPSGTLFASMGGKGGRYAGGAGNSGNYDHTIMLESGGWKISNPNFLERLFGQKAIASIQVTYGQQFNSYNADGSKTSVPFFISTDGPSSLRGGSRSVPYKLVSDVIRP